MHIAQVVDGVANACLAGRRLVPLLLLGLVAVGLADAPVSGRVADGFGNGIAGATVSLGAGLSAATDGDGNYTVASVPDGDHAAWATADGYVFTPTRRLVTVPGGSTGIDFTAIAVGTGNVVAGSTVIYLAGRNDVSVPPVGEDPALTGFPLVRVCVAPCLTAVPEVVPGAFAAVAGEEFRFTAEGGVDYYGGADTVAGPDGYPADFSVIDALGGISAYNGPQGALVGVFLDDGDPQHYLAPAALDFSNDGWGTGFSGLAPALGQVFFIGDGRGNDDVIQIFTAPAGATRLFVGIADAAAFGGAPGAYDDNQGAFVVGVERVNSHVTGTVTVEGSGVAGILVTMEPGYQTYTSTGGLYSFVNVVPGAYTVRPTQEAHLFQPASRDVTVPPDAIKVDFAGTRDVVVSGHVLDTAHAPIPAVDIMVNGELLATTDPNGFFSLATFPGRLTVVPVREGFLFLPPQMTADLEPGWGLGAEFQGSERGIRGRVVDESGVPVASVTVTLGSTSSLTTGIDGTYQFFDVGAGQHVVSAARAGLVFEPPQRLVSVPPLVTDADFVARSTAGGLVVAGSAAIFLAGRADLTIPELGEDPGATGFPLGRNCVAPPIEGFVKEVFPVLLTVGAGEELTFSAWGAVDYYGGTAAAFGPDGDTGAVGRIDFLAGISGYHGPNGALVGVFLSDDGPAEQEAPATLDFTVAGLSPWFTTLEPALRQVFFIGDGKTTAGRAEVAQRFTAPAGATRLFLGIADGFDFGGPPGAYDDNLGAFVVTVARDTYSVTGTVSEGADALAGVTVSLGGGLVGTTDANGVYVIDDVPAGVHNATPTLAGYAFDPPDRSVTVPPSAAGVDFTGTPTAGYTISGWVTLDGVALPGIRVTVADHSTSISAGDGRYGRTGLPAGTYRVFPEPTAEYVFTPPQRLVTVPPTAAYSVSFAAHAAADGLPVAGSTAIYLAGRADVTIPAAGVDPESVGFPLGRVCVGACPDAVLEQRPVEFAATAGDRVQFSAWGGVDYYGGAGGLAGPDGYPDTVGVVGDLAGISAYTGPQGALVGVFLDDANPASAAPPAALDFSAAGLGTTFATLAPQLGQVFFIGDGLGAAAATQTFTVPAGATRVFVGIADAFSFFGAPGAYDDNLGTLVVRMQVSAFSIRGTVTLSNAPLAGVTVALGVGGDVTTAAAGEYVFDNLPAGAYTLTPTLAGYTFQPPSHSLTLGPSTGGMDFVAVPVPVGSEISGWVTLDGIGLPGISVTVDGIGTGSTGSDGLYRYVGLAAGTYRVFPEPTGEYVFTPPQRLITVPPTAAHSVSFAAHSAADGLPVPGSAAIYLAGRTEVTIPPVGADPAVVGFPLGRDCTGTCPDAVQEQFPVEFAATAGDRVQFSAWGGVDYYGGAGGLAGPDGYPDTASAVEALAGISAYNGPRGALVGVFLDDTNPAAQAPPAALDFSDAGMGTTFATLAPQLGQVFFIGDGLGAAAAAQTFTVPAGATRVFVGIADSFDFFGAPGAYDDNLGTLVVRMQVSGFSIRGTVTLSGAPLPGVTVALGAGVETISAATGAYVFDNLPAGDYTLTPSLAGYTFVPPSRSLTVGPSAGGMDFAAVPVAVGLEISGWVTLDGIGLDGIPMSIVGHGDSATMVTGYYAFTGLPAGTYRVFPVPTGEYVFTPPQRLITVPPTAAHSVSFAAHPAAAGLPVPGAAAIYLAGRADVTIPPVGADPELAGFPLGRDCIGTCPAAVQEQFPVEFAALGVGQMQFSASGGVDYYGGTGGLAGPDGYPDTASAVDALAGISAYSGPQGALVGVFLDDTNPATQAPPAALDFSAAGVGTGFVALAPRLGQVFFIGDGLGDSGVTQTVLVPVGATRLFVGSADAFGFGGPPGAYDDDLGAFAVRVFPNAGPDLHRLDYTAGPHGHIDGPATQAVVHGSNGLAVNPVADPGYHFVDWSDGSTAAPRQDLNVTTDLALAASFAADAPTEDLQVLPTSLAVSCRTGTSPAAVALSVRNALDGTVDYSITEEVGWLSVAPAAGSSSGEWDTLTVSFDSVGMAPGTYTGNIVVSGSVGEVETVPVTLAIADALFVRRFAAGCNAAGGTAEVSVLIDLGAVGGVTSLAVRETLPAGWQYQSIVPAAGAPTVTPEPGATGIIEFAWVSIPAFPYTFTYRVTIPFELPAGTYCFAGTGLYRQDGADLPFPVFGSDCMEVGNCCVPHQADQDGDWIIQLSPELTRLIQFYNRRSYHCAAGTEDGYAPGGGADACGPHQADQNGDWVIQLSPELTRLIQFYNSGGYHCQEGTEDGYAPGPSGRKAGGSGGVLGAHRSLAAQGYAAGSFVDVTVALTHTAPSALSALAVEEALPPGWRFVGVVGGALPSLAPDLGADGTLGFAWIGIPKAWPVTFTYRVAVPPQERGVCTFAGKAFCRELAGETAVAIPATGLGRVAAGGGAEPTDPGCDSADLTGVYTATLAGCPLTLTLVQDAAGRLGGVAACALPGAPGEPCTTVTLAVRGRVRSRAGDALLILTLRDANPALPAGSALRCRLGRDGATGLWAGPVVGRLRALGHGLTVSEVVLLEPLASADQR